MKFSCTQENFIKYLAMASRVASRAGNLPILSHVHLKTEAEGVLIKATNLEIGITCKLRGKIEEEGEFTVPAKLLTDYIAFLPKERVDVSLKDNSLAISCAGHKTSIKGLPASDFPLIPAVEEGVRAQVSLPALLEGLEQVLFTISPGETRPEISGALLALQKSKLTIAGTDSYRLSEKTIPLPGEAIGQTKVIAPLRALQELARICAQTKEEGAAAELVISPNQLAVALPAVEFVSRLIEGQYPDYQAIIPTQFGTVLTVSRAELAGAVKAAALFSRAGVYDIALEAQPQANALTVSALNSQTGEHLSTLAAQVKGAPTKIAFNWKYLLEGINALKSPQVALKATDSSSPTLLSEEGGTDYFYIVMPIKE